VYKDEKHNLCIPSEHIFGALIKAGVKFKYENRQTYKEIIKGGVIIEPDMIPLGKKKFDEIDTRSVVIQRARVIRWRPKFNEWEAQFVATIIDDENITTKTLKEIFDKAGQLGIGDYRPRFGRFIVTEYNEME